MYLGDYAAGDTIDFDFCTVDATGLPTALSGGTVSVYKGSSTTESTAGITLTASFDSRAGLNHVTITTASDGTFYADGSQFDAVITAGTVSGVSVVGYVVGRFTLRAQALLYPTTAGRKLTVSAGGEGNANAVSWAGSAITATSLPVATAAGASGGLLIAGSNAATTFATLTSTGTFTINGVSNVSQTGDSFARIGATGSGLTSLAPSATALSTAQWTNTLATNLGTTNTTVATNLNATISSRQATFTAATSITFPTNFGTTSIDGSGRVLLQPTQTGVTIPTVTTVTNGVTLAADQDVRNVTGSVAGSVASVTNPVTVGTNNDKAGYSLTQAFPLNFALLAIDGSGGVDISSASGTAIVSATSAAVTSAHGSGSYVRNTEPPTAADNATAVANYDIGNGRTIAYFLQGGSNRIAFAADGLSFTVYGTDDSTTLYTGTSTRLGSTIGGLRSTDPA